MPENNSYKGFKDLHCWQEARILRQSIGGLVNLLPKEEKYQLSSQLVRASRSVTANIAEGYGRYTYTDTRHFFIQARGSVTELLDHLSVVAENNYLPEQDILTLEKQCETVFRLINGYIAYLDREKAK